MNVIGPKNNISLIFNIIIVVVGIIQICINYLIYKKILNKPKAKYAGDIIAIAKDITE